MATTAKKSEDTITWTYPKAPYPPFNRDIVGGINGKVFRIQRGVPVTITKAQFDLIKRSEDADSATADAIKAAVEAAESGVPFSSL